MSPFSYIPMSICRQKVPLSMEITTSGNHATLFFSSFEISIKGLLIFQPNSVNLSYPSRSLFVMKMGCIYSYSFGTILFTAVRKALLIIWLYQTLGGMGRYWSFTAKDTLWKAIKKMFYDGVTSLTFSHLLFDWIEASSVITLLNQELSEYCIKQIPDFGPGGI